MYAIRFTFGVSTRRKCLTNTILFDYWEMLLTEKTFRTSLFSLKELSTYNANYSFHGYSSTSKHDCNLPIRASRLVDTIIGSMFIVELPIVRKTKDALMLVVRADAY